MNKILPALLIALSSAAFAMPVEYGWSVAWEDGSSESGSFFFDKQDQSLGFWLPGVPYVNSFTSGDVPGDVRGLSWSSGGVWVLSCRGVNECFNLKGWYGGGVALKASDTTKNVYGCTYLINTCPDWYFSNVLRGVTTFKALGAPDYLPIESPDIPPIPEPTTYALLGAGLIGLLLGGRKRRS